MEEPQPKSRKIDPVEAKRRENVLRIYKIVGILSHYHHRMPVAKKEVLSYLRDGGNVNQTYKTDQTLLHRFAGLDKSKVYFQGVIETLLKYGANPNVKSEALGTPLHEAVDIGRWEDAKLLIEYGADVNAVDSRGHGVLAIAILKFGLTTSFENVKFLLSRGADINSENNKGLTVVSRLDGPDNAAWTELRRFFYLHIKKLRILGKPVSVSVKESQDRLKKELWINKNADDQYQIKMKEEILKMERVSVVGKMNLVDLAKMRAREVLEVAKNRDVRRFLEYEWPTMKGRFEIYGDMVSRNVDETMARIRLFEDAVEAFQRLSDARVVEVDIAEKILKQLDCGDLRRILLVEQEFR